MSGLFIKYLKNISIIFGLLMPLQAAYAGAIGAEQKKEIDKVILEMEKLAKRSVYISSSETKDTAPKKKAASDPINGLKLARVDKVVASTRYQKKKTGRSSKPVIKKAKKRKAKQSGYCLGGSYKALAASSQKYDKLISKYSKQYDVSQSLIKAVITAESCFNARALSPKGAEGLMQLMPPTAKRFGIKDSFDPDSNIKAGTRYLKFLLKYYDEDMLNAIAAYNAGEGAVDKYKGIPPYKETRLYVMKVSALYKLYSQGGGILTASSVALLANKNFQKSIFVPRALPKSRFSPYKGRTRNISRGQCANRTSTRLRKSTIVESGSGIWQRIYTVKKGDTLLRVTQKTGVHKNKIKQMNGLNSRARLEAGQQLLVWECRK